MPKETEPVVAGKVEDEGSNLLFAYGRSYLEYRNAIPLYEPERPLKAGPLPLLNGLNAPNCIRDGAICQLRKASGGHSPSVHRPKKNKWSIEPNEPNSRAKVATKGDFVGGRNLTPG